MGPGPRLATSMIGTFLAVIAVALPGALAQQLPAWSIAEICGKEPAQCLELEARARQTVAGGWGVLPDAYRAACLAEARLPADRSWRLLSQCIELQALKGLDKGVIATAATPAEPVPPPKPKVETSAAQPGDVPPPPFGLPAEPPKAQ